MAWIFAGFTLMAIGRSLSMLQVTEDGKLGTFLVAMGVVYFTIGMVLAVMHSRHTGERVRASRE